MVTGNLDTTNLLLGIMAVVSVLEAVALIAAGVMGYKMYSNAMATIRDLETRQVAPLVAKINEILVDVKGVAARVNHETERVDVALHRTIDRVDETAERVKTNVRDKADQVARVLRAVRAGIESFLVRRDQPRSAAAGRI